jgi:allantoinase
MTLQSPQFRGIDPTDEIFLRGVDHFDRLYKDGAKQPRVMAISIHPYLTGAPHRIKYLEMLYDHILARDGVLTWTGSEILDWYRGQTAGGKVKA